MENLSDAEFWKELLTIDNNGTVQWDVSKLVTKLQGNFRDVPRMIANALAVLVLTSNSGSLLAISRRDRRTRFTANLRIVASLSLSNVLIGVCVLLDNIPLFSIARFIFTVPLSFLLDDRTTTAECSVN